MSDRRPTSPDFRQYEHGSDNPSFVAQAASGLIDSSSPNESPDSATAHSSLDSFAIQIHQSLSVKQLANVVVHELRPILGCDRICFLDHRRRFRLIAASDQVGTPARVRQALLLEKFVDAVLRSGQRCVYPDGLTVLPDSIGRLLADYWEHSHGQLILVEPVFSRISDPIGTTRSLPARTLVGALVVERFRDTQFKPGTEKRLDAVLPHLTTALANARVHTRLTSIPGLNLVGQLFESLRHSRSIAWMTYLVFFAAVVGVLSFVNRPFEIDCRGRLMPTERREVFASLDGEVVEVLVDESQQVSEGQVVARLQSRDLEKSVLEQSGLLQTKLKARDAARAELQGRTSAQTRSQSARDQAQFEVLNSEIETINRQLELLHQQQQELIVRAPITGTITSDRPREKLLGRPVRRGESLLEIMDETGDWQLELAVAEKKIGHLLSRKKAHSRIDVKFRQLAAAQKSFDCQVTRVADRTMASAELGSCGLIYCDVTSTDLAVRQIGSEVSGRICCGQRSLLFIWFHEFWELLQRHWWL